MKTLYINKLATVTLLCVSMALFACGGGGGSASEPTAGNALSSQTPFISGTPPPSVEVGSLYSFTPDAYGMDGSGTLTYSVSSLPDWASFDTATGNLSGIPNFADVGNYDSITLSVSDGNAFSNLTDFSIAVTISEVELALATGDASVVSNATSLEDALLATIESTTSTNTEALSQIFNLDQDGYPRLDGSSITDITWNPTHDAARLFSEFGENSDLLISNAISNDEYTIKNESFAVIGETNARYIVMGGNPMRNYRRHTESINEQMHLMLENSIAWLTKRDNLDTNPLNVVTTHLAQNYYFPDEVAVREWLDERLAGRANYNEPNACEGSMLSACLDANTDLLIISNDQDEPGQETVVAQAVKTAMSQGIPVLYMHVDGGETPLSMALLPLFDVSFRGDNYWHRLSLSNYDPIAYLGKLSAEVSSVRVMVENFSSGNFNVNWDDCNEENCADNASLTAEFWDGAKQVKSMMQSLDKAKINVFDTPDRYRYKKLLALLGDHYRLGASFPLDRNVTPSIDFLQTFYADHAVYQYRDIVGVWGDMGNFSRVDFSHITPTSRVINHESKKHFRATGAYALPGQTVTATRNDTSDVGVSVFVNTLRAGSTHVFAEFGYNRPQFTQGVSIPIEHGETISFTSPSGGPIQLRYDTNDLPIQIKFDNVGEHPYWQSSDDNEIFESKMVAAEYDWAEIAAPSFEVHSKHDKMLDSMTSEIFGPNGGTAQQLADATMRYVHNFPHVLAGFQGPGIDVVDEIHSFAGENGLEVYNLDLVKHMNADQATCGYGCSGNPYDAYWSFSPIGHGDIHELGHGLERSRFRFTGWDGHAITNPYSYYTKSQYHIDTGNEPGCQSLPFEASFNILNDSFAQLDPSAYVQANLWTNPSWSDGAAMTIQMMMAAEDNGALIDGWHLLARMHIIEREYQQAVKSDTAWLEKRGGLGMGMYARSAAMAMSPEDWLLIVVSHATGFDFRTYFDVWAHVYSAEAAAQVVAMALPTMPVNYYVSSGDGYCKGQGFDGNKIPLDGAQRSWPQ